MKKVKFFAILMTVCFISTIALPMNAVLAKEASQNSSSVDNDFIFDFSDLDYSIEKISEGHLRMFYLTEDDEKLQYDFITYKNNEMAILLNGLEMYRIPIKQTTSNLAVDTKIATLSETYYFWDDMYYVTGPYIVYPHLYRDQYGISPYSDFSWPGTQVYHCQIQQSTSTTLNAGGCESICFALGVLLGNAIGGTAGAIIGGIVGIIFGTYAASSGTFVDEYGCIWWMVGKTFVQWLHTYESTIYGLYMTFGPVVAQSFVAGAFASGGYLRVGTLTLWDAIGAGNP